MMKHVLLIAPVLLLSSALHLFADFRAGLDAYESGDYETALREWRPLAEQGNAYAQYNLGLMYADGEGVPEDNVYAYMWWNIAASQGDADASTSKEVVARGMSQSAIEEAQRLSRECVARDYKDC